MFFIIVPSRSVTNAFCNTFLYIGKDSSKSFLYYLVLQFIIQDEEDYAYEKNTYIAYCDRNIVFFRRMRRPGPDKTVSGMLDALKNWDTAALAGYIDVDQLYADANIASENQDQMTEILKLIMKNLSYEILDTQVSGDTAVVTVSITNTNMSVVITEYFTNVLVLAFSGNYSTDAELESAAYDLLQTSIQNHMDQTITNQVDVQLTKQDGQWVTTMSDELMMPSTAA